MCKIMDFVLGVDIGGTKIAAGLIDSRGNCIYRVDLPSIKTDREVMFQQVVRSIKKVLSKSQLTVSDLKGISIGVPGKVDSENGIAVFQNNLPWRNFPLIQRIKEHFSVENVSIENDVYLAGFAEWVINGKLKKETFVYFTISTGISCCTIHNGNIVRGAGFAGEIGFLPIAYNPLTKQYESVEAVASGPGIVKLANETKSCLKVNKNMETQQIIKDFKKQEPYAIGIMDYVFDCIARTIYTVSCVLDPNKLVLGGGVINHHPDLIVSIKASLEKYLLPSQIDLLERIEISRLRENSGLVGAGLRFKFAHEERSS